MGKGGKTIDEMRAENPRFDKDLEITFYLADKAQADRDSRTADQLIERYLLLRDHIDGQTKALSEFLKPLRDEMDNIQGLVHGKLLELGGDKPSIKTAHGTAFTTTTKNPKIENRDTFIDFCLDNWDTFGNAMMQLTAPQVTAVSEYMDAHDGNLPPGVGIAPLTKVTIRKA